MSYLQRTAGQAPDPGAVAYFASLDQVGSVDGLVAARIAQELIDQRSSLKLIASENYSSLAVQLAQGNLLTDKYAEGVAERRFYAGCDNVDAIESRAVALAKELFGAEHAYVQPHSGADANLVAFAAILAQRVEAPVIEKLGAKSVATLSDGEWAQLRHELHDQKLLGMDYYSGGHLTHGYRFNISARLFEAHQYTVDRQTGLLDLDTIHRQLQELRPLILLAGYSAYPRAIDFAALRQMADEVGAVLMVDMAHFSGLVAGGVFEGDHNPIPFAHVVTSTTHKTLRGPRGGLVLAKDEFAEAVDKGCPAVLGGPLPHVMAAKAVAFDEALRPEFATYTAAIVANARELAAQFERAGNVVPTGGTDNHIVLLDVARTWGITGRQAESALRSVGLTLNRNSLPFDVNGPWYTSGLRFGTAAITTLGMGTNEMAEVASIVNDVLGAVRPTTVSDGAISKAKFDLDEGVVDAATARVTDLTKGYPLYPEIDHDLLSRAAGW